MGRVVKFGVTYEDGDYEGFCPTCKTFVTFPGVVRLTNAGRVTTTGPCPTCGTTVTRKLV
jgi:hypothetical protein